MKTELLYKLKIKHAQSLPVLSKAWEFRVFVYPQGEKYNYKMKAMSTTGLANFKIF